MGFPSDSTESSAHTTLQYGYLPMLQAPNTDLMINYPSTNHTNCWVLCLLAAQHFKHKYATIKHVLFHGKHRVPAIFMRKLISRRVISALRIIDRAISPYLVASGAAEWWRHGQSIVRYAFCMLGDPRDGVQQAPGL